MTVVNKHSFRDICRELCIDHQVAVELLRRVKATVMGSPSSEVIIQNFGTFYKQTNKERSRVLNGSTYVTPENNRLRLRSNEVAIPPADWEIGGFSTNVNGAVLLRQRIQGFLSDSAFPLGRSDDVRFFERGERPPLNRRLLWTSIWIKKANLVPLRNGNGEQSEVILWRNPEFSGGVYNVIDGSGERSDVSQQFHSGQKIFLTESLDENQILEFFIRFGASSTSEFYDREAAKLIMGFNYVNLDGQAG